MWNKAMAIWQNSIHERIDDYLLILGLVALSLLAGLAVRLIWRFVFLPLARRRTGSLNALIFERTARPISTGVAVAGLYFTYVSSLEILALKPGRAGKGIDALFFIFGVLLGGWLAFEVGMAILEWYLHDLTRRGDGRSDMHVAFSPIVARVLKVVILGIALIMVLGYFNVNVSGLLATAGIASLAVALAAQDTIANMIGGFALMADRTFRPGDRLELPDGGIGDVVDISLRTTRIRTFDDTLLIIPNSELAKARIVNQSYPTQRMAIRHKLGVAYGSDVAKVKRLLLEVAAMERDVLKDPAPVVHFTAFGDSSLDMAFTFWIGDYRKKADVLDRMNMEIDRRFREEKIEIPFPQRDLNIRSLVEKSNAQANIESGKAGRI